jgi:hypothetical protein
VLSEPERQTLTVNLELSAGEIRKLKFTAEELQGQTIDDFCSVAVKEFIQTLIDNPDRLTQDLQRYLTDLDRL